MASSVPPTTLLLYSLAISFSFFLFTTPASSETADPETQELINKICRQMEDYGFCNKVFLHWLRAPWTDLEGLTQITLETTTENASNNYMFVLSMRDHSTDPNSKRVLEDCMRDYSSITDAFVEAIRLFSMRDFKGVVNSEMPTSKTLARCQDTLRPLLSGGGGGGGGDSYTPLIERNRQQRILIAMAVVTAHLLTTK